MKRVGAAVATALLTALAACMDFLTDAATAIAYDIEEAVGSGNGSATTTLVHVPKTRRGGCENDYRVQFSRDAALVVWCRAAGSSTESVSSHSTTYHLRFVTVPETLIVDKKKGESLSIELATAAGKPAIVAVR